MMHAYQLFLVLFLPLYVAKPLNITLLSVDMCKDRDYGIVVDVNVSVNGQPNVMNATVTTNYTLDDILLTVLDLEYSPDDVHYKRITTLKNKFCSGLNLNFGELLYQPMRMAGISTKCPILPGKYTLREYKLDFKKFRVPILPMGYIVPHIKLLDEANNIVHCSIAKLYISH